MNALEKLLSANTNETSSNKQETHMNQEDSILHIPYVLVAGPECGDAEFYRKWLLAAEKAEALWEEALTSHWLKEISLSALQSCCLPEGTLGN